MSIEAMKMALEALEGINDADRDKDFLDLKQFVRLDIAIEALRTALQSAQASEPVARVELMQTGGNAGLATRIVEIDDPLRERLRPGDVLYTNPAPGVPDDAERWRAVENGGGDLTLRLHYSAPHLRAAIVDAAIAASQAKKETP